MRSIVLAAVSAIATLASAASALAAGLPELHVHTLASATLSPVSVTDDQTTNVLPGLFSHSHDNDVSGLSFANATSQASFAALHAYADAFDSPTGGGAFELPEVQSSAEASYTEYFDGSTFDPSKTYLQQIFINGSTSPQPTFGPGPGAVVIWRLDDLTASSTIFLGSWSEVNPVTVFPVPFVVPAGDETRLFMDLIVFAYDGAQSKPGVVFSDFLDTVTNTIDPVGGGADVVGASGHDYATPSASGGVPEPAIWALTLMGFGGLGAALRRRRRAMA